MEPCGAAWQDGYIKRAPRLPVLANGASTVFDDMRKEATEMGFISIVAGILLFLIPGACLYVGYMTDSGRM